MPLINGQDQEDVGAAQSAPDQGASGFHNQMLGKAEQTIMARQTPQNQRTVLKVVTAGMKIAMQGGNQSALAQLPKQTAPLEMAVKGAVNLVALMYKASRGTMPAKAIPAAATILMLHALDFLDQTGTVEVDEDVLTQAMKKITDQIFRQMGVSNQMLQEAAKHVHTIQNNPGMLEQVQRHAGMVKHPGASEPTSMPGAEGEEQ